jgi:hypothetical protein
MVRLTRVARIVGIVALLLTASCSSVKSPAPVSPPQTTAPQTAAPQVAAAAVVPADTPTASQSPPAPTVPSQVEAAPVAAAPPPTAPPTTSSTGPSAAKAAAPNAKAAAKALAAPSVPVAPPPKTANIAPEVATQKSPPLDLTSLEQRLKDTKAIGVLTKITLKNQIDDLLNQFRAYYQGKLHTALAELRRPYDLLVLKVLSLLQDSDPTLAAAIAASREAIWGILSDPAKFAKL